MTQILATLNHTYDIQQESRKMLAESLEKHVSEGLFFTAISLKIMFENNLYRELGYENQMEYIKTALPFEKSTAYRLIDIADAFCEAFSISLKLNELNKLPYSNLLKDLHPVGSLMSGETIDEIAPKFLKDIWNLGIKKVFFLSMNLSPQNYLELATHGYFYNSETLSIFSIDKITSLSFVELQLLFHPERAKTITENPTPEPQLLDLAKESKAILTQARFVRVKMSQLSQYANPSIASNMGLTIPPEFTAKASQLVDLTNRLLRIEEQLETLLGVE